MADPPHSVPPGGGQPDSGSRSGFLGQRKSRAGPGSAAVQGSGGSGGHQPPQQVTWQSGSDPGSTSQFLGQRKSRAGPGSAAGQGAGGSGSDQPPQQMFLQTESGLEGQSGDRGQRKTKAQATAGTKDAGGQWSGQSSQQHTGQSAVEEGAGSGPHKTSTVSFSGIPTIHFISGSNRFHTVASPLNQMQWKHLFKEKQILDGLLLAFSAQCRKDDSSITFTSESQEEDLHQWADGFLAELKTLSSRICSIELVLDSDCWEDFKQKWSEETFSKTNLVTILYERRSSRNTVVLLSERANVLQKAHARGNAILDGLRGKFIEVPLPYFDDHCFLHFIQPDKYPDIKVLYEREGGKHVIKLHGPPSERDKALREISSRVAALMMEQVNWPEIRAWISRTENQDHLKKYLAKCNPGIHLVSDGESPFLMGPTDDVVKAVSLLKELVCTKAYPLSEEILRPLMQNVKAEDEGEGTYFIPKYYLLVSHNPSTEQLTLAGPLGYHTKLLQKDIKLCLKKPAPGVLAAVQRSAKGVLSITTRADDLEIQGPVAKVQEAFRQITVAVSKTQPGAAEEEKLPLTKEISQDRLVILLQMDAVKRVVNEHLSLLGTNLADVKWSIDATSKHLKIMCSDRKEREKAEKEIKNLFAERETIMEDLDEIAADRLQENWPDLVTDLHEHNDCSMAYFAPDKKWVLLATLRDRLDRTSQRLDDLMQFYRKDQAILSLQLSRAQYAYLKKACREDVIAVRKTVAENGGTLNIQSAGDDNWQVKMTGSPTLVSVAVNRLQQLRDDVNLVDVADAAISCLTSREGKKFVSSLEETYKCYIDIPEAALDDHEKMFGYAEVVLAGGTTVSLHHGPLQPEGVELVALPVPVDLEKKMTPITCQEEYTNILPDLGTHIPRLCEKVRKGKGKVLLVTPPRKLKCRKVALMAVPSKWYDGEKKEKEFVRSAVTELMETTMGEKCSSVAFEIARNLPVKGAETSVLVSLREFFEQETEKAASPTGIKTVKLFTSRQAGSRDLSELLGNAFPGLLNSAQRKIVVAAADKGQAEKAAQELCKFAATVQEESESFVHGEGARKRQENPVQKDISKEFPSFSKRMCTSSLGSMTNAVNDIMRELVGCSISSRAGRLFLHFPAEKEHQAFAVCRHFDMMIGAAESPSLPSSTALQKEYDEVLVNAAMKFFPEMLKKVRVNKNEHGKFVFTPALSKEDHSLISSLQQSEVQVKDAEREKAKTITNAFVNDADIYVEYLPSKAVVVAVVRKYDLMHTATQRIKLHLGQMKTALRGRRQFAAQPGGSDLDARGAAAAAEWEAEEATGPENKITLPGGLVVVPYMADITKLKVDAIVNDANEHLNHAGGVARAIAVAGGPELESESTDYIDMNGPLKVSGVCHTGPGRLPCNRVLHAVGPRWDSRTAKVCRQQLYDTVQNCCREADKWDLREIAMPPMSSGIFGMPKEECTEMYCKALLDFDQQPDKKLKTVHFVDIKDDMPLALLKALRKATGQGQQRTRPTEADMDMSQGCVICTDKDFNQPVKLNDCNHVFCKACIEQWFQNKPTCPICNKVYGVNTGTMPPGTMNVSRERSTRLAGFDNCGCIMINYSFYDGVQKAEHPNPGQPYRGTRRTAYLPDNAEGNKVLGLLREAWDRKLTFTIGRSTGFEYVVTWNDIHHKTSPVPGHPFGYPDPDYLTRVQEELAASGVTEESIKLSKSGKAQDFSQFYTPLVLPRPTRL